MLPPSWRMCSIRPHSWRRDCGSRPAVGSSSSSSAGSWTTAMYRARRCCCPPESCLNGLCASSSSPIARRPSAICWSESSHPVEPGVQPHDLPDLQLGLEAGRLKLHAHPCPGLSGMAPAVDAVEQDRPGLGLDQPFDRAQRARLAGSVRPQQTEDLSPADLEADRVDCRLGAVSDCQVAHLEDPADRRRQRASARPSPAGTLAWALGTGSGASSSDPSSCSSATMYARAWPPLSTCTLSRH